MPERSDVVVIGAGIIGCAVAHELARSGRRVVCVDKGPAPGAGSTSSSSSIIRFSYSTLAGVLTAWESAVAWEDWAGHLGHVDPDGMARFVRTGMLVFETPGDGAGNVLKLWDDIGIPYERLDGDEIARRWPALDTGRFWPPKRVDDPAFADDPVGRITAYLEPRAGFVDDPMLAARNLAHAARAEGVTFRFHAEVVSVERHDGRVSGVTLASGEQLLAPVVVNVGGPHSSRLNELAGIADEIRIRHRPLRQEVFVVPSPDGLSLDDGTPIVADMDIGQYFRPNLGGTTTVGGAEPECDPLEWVDDPDHYADHTTVEHFESTMLRLARRVPSFGIPHRPVGLAALYDAADDWVPIYDGSSLGGWFMACATSGNQFKNAPMAGRFLRALVEAAEAGHDHDLDPVTVPAPRTGRSIDLGAFSRRREPAVTTGTVMG
jgi:sarcosine oxidase subunit beta